MMEAESGQWNPFGCEPRALELPCHARNLPVLWADPSGDGDKGVWFQKGGKP